MDGEAWDVKFRLFDSEEWRLETLPEYRASREVDELRDFRAGKCIDPLTHHYEYMEDLKRVRRAGKTKGRVHVLTRPLS
ncbi:DUF6879 family protein [Streptomyces sp. NPDC001571]